MGAFMIFDIKFKTKKDRTRFEKENKELIIHTLVDEHANSYGFSSWLYLRNPLLEPIYYVGFMGYAEPKEILKKSLIKDIKITFMAYLPINDKGASWDKIRGRW